MTVLAAVLIVRNEARCIRRCLESVAPWVDKIVVLDTGSADETPAIARKSGAEVHHIEWPHDFAKARNHALDLADADWNLIIDADEWIEHGGSALRDWSNGPPRLGRLAIHSNFDDQGETRESVTWITRLLPRGVRFEGRVHEQAVSPLPREQLGLHLGHDGYRDAQLDAKRDRNRPLLLAELEDRPDDAYLLYQLGKDAEGRDGWIEATDLYARALDRTQPGIAWRHDLMVRHLHALGRTDRIDEALDLAGEWLEQMPDSPDLFFVTGNLLLDRARGDPAQAVQHWLPLAMGMWESCLALGERPDLEGSVRGRGSHLAQHNLDLVRGQLALLGGAS